MEYLRIVKVGSIYDWVDEDNKDTDAPTVGYLNKRGIEEMEKQDVQHSPIRFRAFIEQAMRDKYLFRKDLYELKFSVGSLSKQYTKEWYHSLKDMKERFTWLFDRAYLIIVHDVNNHMITNIYNIMREL